MQCELQDDHVEAAQGLAALACFPPGGGGGAAALPGSHGRGHGGTCQQCGAGLAGHKRFYQRYRACETCALSAAVVRGGELQRFCQQCGRFHPVARFNGLMRTCREQLARHAERQRLRRQQRREWAAAAAAGGAPTMTEEPPTGSDGSPAPGRASAGKAARQPPRHHRRQPSAGPEEAAAEEEEQRDSRAQEEATQQRQLRQLLLQAAARFESPAGASPAPQLPLPPLTPRPLQQQQHHACGEQAQQTDGWQAWEWAAHPRQQRQQQAAAAPPAQAHPCPTDGSGAATLGDYQAFWLHRLSALLVSLNQDQAKREAAAVRRQGWVY